MPHQHTDKKLEEPRDHLTGEHHIGDAGQAILAILFMAVWITDSFFEYSTFLNLGFLMLNISLAAVAIWVMGIGFLHYISRYEEKLLLARYGEEYKHYMTEVPMWIPRLWRK